VGGHDPLADEGGIDLVDEAVEADGTVLLHLAGGLEQEQIVEIEGDLVDQSAPQSVPFTSHCGALYWQRCLSFSM